MCRTKQNLETRSRKEENSEQEKEEEAGMLDKFGSKENKQKNISADPMAVSSDGHTLIIEDLVQAINDERDPMIGLDRDLKLLIMSFKWIVPISRSTRRIIR